MNLKIIQENIAMSTNSLTLDAFHYLLIKLALQPPVHILLCMDFLSQLTDTQNKQTFTQDTTTGY